VGPTARPAGGELDRRHLNARRPGAAGDDLDSQDAENGADEEEGTSSEEEGEESGPTSSPETTITSTSGKASTTAIDNILAENTGKPPKAPAMGLAVDDSSEEEYVDQDEEPCEEDPYTVYVTVTITAEAEGTLIASPTNDEDCEDCYAGNEGGPTDESQGEDDTYDTFTDDYYTDSMSASASATGDDYDGEFGSNAYARFNAMPILVSLGLCALTSLAAGFLFMGP
jgi:hypothetical protein